MEESKPPVGEPLIRALSPDFLVGVGWPLRVPAHSREACTSVFKWLRRQRPASERQHVGSDPVPWRRPRREQVELTWLRGLAASAGQSGVVAAQGPFSWDSVLRVIFRKNKTWPP